MRTLRDHLAAFDGKRTDTLAPIAVSCSSDPGAIKKLVMIAEKSPDERVAVAATWVVLAMCKAGQTSQVNASVVARLGPLLNATSHWETRLHVLQTLGRVDPASLLSKPQIKALGAVAMGLTEDPKPLVRAWSLGLLAMIGGSLDAGLRRRAAQKIAAATARESASVKARLRQLRNAGAWDWMEPELG